MLDEIVNLLDAVGTLVAREAAQDHQDNGSLSSEAGKTHWLAERRGQGKVGSFRSDRRGLRKQHHPRKQHQPRAKRKPAKIAEE